MRPRIDAGRPIAHVAAEAGISRRATSSARTPEDIADLVEALRRRTKPARLAADPQRLHGITLAPSTVHRIPVRQGLNRLRDLDPPTGEQLRKVIRYEYDRVGDLVHVDVKKLGRIATGGGWRRPSSTRAGTRKRRCGCTERCSTSYWA
ncbi:hypothetical protein [Streptomyces longwoodensis]|uniref:hypothetical protein n=1 Tax=Streptomyces longwoodensis TaxID=68231 RepID=UPI00380F0FD2